MSSTPNKAIMHYVPGRGRAELIRFAMAITGVEVTNFLKSFFF